MMFIGVSKIYIPTLKKNQNNIIHKNKNKFSKCRIKMTSNYKMETDTETSSAN